MHISQLSDRNLERVVDAWNAALIHDELTLDRFRAVFLEDPNYEPQAVSVMEDDDGGVLGLSACVARRTAEGKDGRGRDYDFGTGFLKGFFVTGGSEGRAVAAQLLAAAEAYCAHAGKDELRITEYAGPYVFPGLDVRYERLRGILAEHGYRDAHTIEDVGADLCDPALASRLAQAQDRAGSSVELATWHPRLLPKMRTFVEEGDQVQWFPRGWEAGFQRPQDNVLVLMQQEEILGWAHFGTARPTAGFGPILVLKRARGNGYGALLLLESMMRARQQGVESMLAGWANTGFYVATGWHITRRYAVLSKSLSRAAS
jgi:GNAT superfamily N-acetyltransferase